MSNTETEVKHCPHCGNEYDHRETLTTGEAAYNHTPDRIGGTGYICTGDVDE